MAVPQSEYCKCEKCGKTMAPVKFYTYRDGRKTELCKQCLTMHIDNFDPSTYLWLCEKMDIPYIKAEWNVLRNKAFEKDPEKMNGMSVFGKYLSKMKLKQWSDYSWADTRPDYGDPRLKGADSAVEEELTESQQKDKEEFNAHLKEALEAGEISEAEYKTLTSTEVQQKTKQEEEDEEIERRYREGTSNAIASASASAPANSYNEDLFMSEEELIDFGEELTQEDKIYLAMKWGRLYRPNEWVDLERKYNEMKESFDIQDSDTEGTLILICKTYLKMNQAIDCGDMETYNKLSRSYESLRKSAKFTKAQKKEKDAGDFDSVGQIVLFAESKKGGGRIPRHDISIPLDIIDETMLKLKDYYQTLVRNDPTINQQIENYIKKRNIAAEMEADAADENFTLSDADLLNHKEELQAQRDEDEALLSSLGGGDES